MSASILYLYSPSLALCRAPLVDAGFSIAVVIIIIIIIIFTTTIVTIAAICC